MWIRLVTPNGTSAYNSSQMDFKRIPPTVAGRPETNGGRTENGMPRPLATHEEQIRTGRTREPHCRDKTPDQNLGCTRGAAKTGGLL